MKEQYPTAEMTDKKVVLKVKQEDSVPPPEKILVIAPNG